MTDTPTPFVAKPKGQRPGIVAIVILALVAGVTGSVVIRIVWPSTETHTVVHDTVYADDTSEPYSVPSTPAPTTDPDTPTMQPPAPTSNADTPPVVVITSDETPPPPTQEFFPTEPYQAMVVVCNVQSPFEGQQYVSGLVNSPYSTDIYRMPEEFASRLEHGDIYRFLVIPRDGKVSLVSHEPDHMGVADSTVVDRCPEW